jgi:hypothetical protein
MFHTHAEQQARWQFFYTAVPTDFRRETVGQQTLAKFGQDLISS